MPLRPVNVYRKMLRYFQRKVARTLSHIVTPRHSVRFFIRVTDLAGKRDSRYAPLMCTFPHPLRPVDVYVSSSVTPRYRICFFIRETDLAKEGITF